MNFRCKKCGGVNAETKVKGNQIGLYCADCGTWQKWIPKNQLHLYQVCNVSQEQRNKNAIIELIDTLMPIIGYNEAQRIINIVDSNETIKEQDGDEQNERINFYT